MSDVPIVIVLLVLLGAAVWIVRQARRDDAVPEPGAPSGQPYLPLAPTCVDPSRRWLLLPSQEV